MRNSTLLKLLFTVILGIASIFGVLTVTAQPVHAVDVYCWHTLGDCWYLETRTYDSGAFCCIYQCPDGNEVVGMCYQGW